MAMPRVKIGVSLLITIFGLLLPGTNPWFIAGVLAALAIHEISHLLTSNLLGYQVYELKLTIFGGCLAVDPLFGANPNAEMVIAVAGPSANFLMALGVVYLDFLGFHHDYLEYWRQLNLSIGLVNLLPAYPLDGGRIIHAWLAKTMGLKTAARVSLGITLGVGLILLISGGLRLFFKTGGFTFLMVGFFVLAQFWFGRFPEFNVWKILRQKQKKLSQNGFIDARLVRVEPGTPLRLPLQHFGAQEYLVFFMEDARINAEDARINAKVARINAGDAPKNFRFISEEQAWQILSKEGYQATFYPGQGRIKD